MTQLSKGYAFSVTELVTNVKLNNLVDDATITDDAVDTAQIADDAVTTDKILNNAVTTDKILNDAVTADKLAESYALGDGTVNPTNLLANGNFESWSAGTSAAPDGWTTTGADIEVAKETTIIKVGSSSVKITRNGTDCLIYQSIIGDYGLAYWKGRTITAGCWVYATVADRARLRFSSGGEIYGYSSYHTGNSTWQFLTVTTTISATASAANLHLLVDTGDTSAYFDGAMLVEGSSAFAFSPKPAEEGVWADYSAVSTIVGWSSFTTKLIYTKKIGKTVFVVFNLSGTSNATSISFTLPYVLNFPSTIQVAWGNGANNGTTLSSGGRFYMSGSTVVALSDMASGAWTSTGVKTTIGQFFYETT